jgi:hypothetical protein
MMSQNSYQMNIFILDYNVRQKYISLLCIYFHMIKPTLYFLTVHLFLLYFHRMLCAKVFHLLYILLWLVKFVHVLSNARMARIWVVSCQLKNH